MFSFGIGTKNIVITDGKAQQTRTGQTAEQTAQSLYTDIRTETAEEQSGRLQNVFDKEAVQKELDVQREVSQQFSKNVQEAKAEINRKLDALEEQKKAGIISQSEYEKERKNWDNLHLGLSIVSGALLAPTDSALGIVAAAASPKVTQEIGQHFKHNAELNKLDGGNRPEEGSKEHIALHTVNSIPKLSHSCGLKLSHPMSGVSSGKNHCPSQKYHSNKSGGPVKHPSSFHP